MIVHYFGYSERGYKCFGNVWLVKVAGAEDVAGSGVDDYFGYGWGGEDFYTMRNGSSD